jgi:Protein of unknown function (DUF4231)
MLIQAKPLLPQDKGGAGNIPQAANRAEVLVQTKHDEYAKLCRRYRFLYYLLRLLAGLSAALLPFVVSSVPTIATALSIIIVITTVIDMIFNPRDRWKLYSRAADLLTIERLKRSGEYLGYESLLSLLTTTESAKLESLVTLEDVTKKAKDAIRP